MSPKIDDLRALGFIPKKTSPQLQKAVFDFFSLHTPYQEQMLWYMNRYGNTHNLCRKAIAIYAYGISDNNLNQFGGEMSNLLYDAFLNIIRSMMRSWYVYSGVEVRVRIRFTRKHVFAFSNMMIDMFLDEAKDQSMRALYCCEIPYRGYRAPRKEKIRGNREYKIVRDAWRYE